MRCLDSNRSRAPAATASLPGGSEGKRGVDRSAFVQLQIPSRGGRGEAERRRTNDEEQTTTRPTSHRPPATVTPTPSNPRGSASSLLEINHQFFIKNAEQLLLPRYTPFTMVVVHSNKSMEKEKPKSDRNSTQTSDTKEREAKKKKKK